MTMTSTKTGSALLTILTAGSRRKVREPVKLWMYLILTELHDCAPGATIMSNEPRTPYQSPRFVYKGAAIGDSIPWGRFNQLVDMGYLVELTDLRQDYSDDGDPFIITRHTISDTGRQALAALPNWDKREEKRKAVMA